MNGFITIKKIRMHTIRSDNGSEFTTQKVQKRLENLEVTVYITPGNPWENEYNEKFNGILRDKLLNREIFYTLEEAKNFG